MVGSLDVYERWDISDYVYLLRRGGRRMNEDQADELLEVLRAMLKVLEMQILR